MKMSRWLLTGAITLGLLGLGVSTASAQKPEGTPAKKSAQADKPGENKAGKKGKKSKEDDEDSAEAAGDRARGKKGNNANRADNARGQKGERAKGEAQGKARGEEAAGEAAENAENAAGEARGANAKGKKGKVIGEAVRAKKAMAHPNDAIEKELQKHAKRIGTIERLKSLAKEKENEKLGEKADMLLEKEKKRHERKLALLQADAAPGADGKDKAKEAKEAKEAKDKAAGKDKAASKDDKGSSK
jgi:hypothetical protein